MDVFFLIFFIILAIPIYLLIKIEKEDENNRIDGFNKKIKKIEKNNKDIKNILELIKKDFSKHPRQEKIKTIDKDPIYFFENGYKIVLVNSNMCLLNRDNKMMKSLELNHSYYLKYLDLLLDFSKELNITYTNIINNNESKKYIKIKEKVELRTEQLKNLNSNDPNYQSLKNELENYKTILNKLKNND